MVKNIYILHSFNARPYFEAIEYYAKNNNIHIEYRETNWLKAIIKLALGKKCVNCEIKLIIQNILFSLKVPFMKDEIIIYGTGPYDFRFLWYSLLKNKNNFIYHTSHHIWGANQDSVFLYSVLTSTFKYFWKKKLKSRHVKIVAVTKESQKTLEENFELSSRVTQIYHSIDLDKFTIENKNKIKKLKILFVGRLVYEKGLDILVDVIQSVDSDKFEFTIVGSGDYKDKISFIFENDNVNYLGWVGCKNEMASIFNKHDILLNPSIRYKDWEELFGIVNIEAMASALVVIASNHIGPKEIIENTVNGLLVEDNNSNIIVEKLNMFYENREYLSKISQSAILRANDFSIENISSQWEGVINGK